MDDLDQNDGVPALKDNYVSSDGRDLSQYISVYYKWAAENPERALLEPANVVARAILSLVPLEEKDLPYAVEEDGQRGAFEARICCLRMFQTDPMFTGY